jgi:hypothetical protein
MRRRAPFLHQRAEIFHFFRRDENGKRREESLRTSDLELAIRRYDQRQQEIRRDLNPTQFFGQSIATSLHQGHRSICLGQRFREPSRRDGITPNSISPFNCVILEMASTLLPTR